MYQVKENTDGRGKIYADFRSAERMARRKFAKEGYASIYSAPTPNTPGELLAEIAIDGTGKVWTDLTWKGAEYA